MVSYRYKIILMELLLLKVGNWLRMLERTLVGKHWVTFSTITVIKFIGGHHVLLLRVIVVHHQVRVHGACHRCSPLIHL